MLAALRRVSLRHFAAHKLRTLSTVLGIALGVATLVGIRLVNESVSRSFARTIDRMAGKTVLQITNGDVGVPEDLVEEVKVIPGVKVAAPSVQGFVPVAGLQGERLYIFGIDLLADQELREYQSGSSETSVEDPLVFLAQPDSVALTVAFLERNHLHPGDRVRVQSASGATDLTVRATLNIRSGPATLFAGRIAVMDVFAAQRLFRLDRRFSQIDIGAGDGADVSALEAALKQRVGGRGVVERPLARGETLEKLLAGTELTLTVGAALAIVVAVYLIFNTMTIAVAERRRETGILRAAGMRRGEVVRWILCESLLLGIAGDALGVWLGLWFARGLSATFTANVSARFLPVEAPLIVLHPGVAVSSAALGLGAALLAAALPAREAVRVAPVEAMRPGSADENERGYRLAAVIGGVLMLVSVPLWAARRHLSLDPALLSALSQSGLLIGVSLLAPSVVRAAAIRVEPVLGRLLGAIGILASRSLVSRIRRVAITAAALLVALANAVALASLISTLERTMNLMLDAEFGVLDLGVASGGGIGPGDATPLPGSLADEIAALPGVRAVDAERWVKIPYQGSLTYLAARDASVYRQGLRRLVMIEGDFDTAVAALAGGESVIVSDVFAHRFGKKVGDRVTLRSPSGEVTMAIAAIHLDMLDLGMIIVDRSAYRRLWRDDSITFVDPVLTTKAEATAVTEEIRRRFGDRYGVSVVAFEQIRRQNEEVLQQSVAAAYPLIAIAMTIALLGVLNSLFASVLDRIREIGLLRAIGATRRQIVRSVVLESAIVGLGGGLFGIFSGSILGYMFTQSLLPDVFGIAAFYRYPTSAVVFTLFAAVALAAAAGYVPGRAAGRFRVTEALKYE